MKHLCDANLFVALAVGQHANHPSAARWFSELKNDDAAAFCRATQNSFLRLLTQAVAEHYTPLTNRQAWTAYDQLCQDDALAFAQEPHNLETVWRKLARQSTASPKVWMDAYLAAFAITGGFRMTTFDRGFKTFEPHGLDLLLLTS